MIKCPVCRKLPGDLSVFLKQPQMVCSFRCNTSEQCYVEVSPCLALGRAGLPEVFFFFFLKLWLCRHIFALVPFK